MVKTFTDLSVIERLLDAYKVVSLVSNFTDSSVIEGLQDRLNAFNAVNLVRNFTDLFVVSRSDLIASKIAAGRKIDLEDVRILQLEEQEKDSP